VSRADRGIDTAKNDSGVRLKPPDVFDDFADSQVPVRHHGLNENSIEAPDRQKALEVLTRSPESVKVPRNIGKGRRLGHELPVKASPSKEVAVPGDKIIKCRQGAGAQPAAHAQEPVRAQPEVVSREVVDGRINQQDLHCALSCRTSLTILHGVLLEFASAFGKPQRF
jgi:hypothetical protein